MTRPDQLQADALASRQYMQSTGLTERDTHLVYARQYRRQAMEARAEGWDAMADAYDAVAQAEENAAGGAA